MTAIRTVAVMLLLAGYALFARPPEEQRAQGPLVMIAQVTAIDYLGAPVQNEVMVDAAYALSREAPRWSAELEVALIDERPRAAMRWRM